ncbi:hypothetical protein [Microbacterium paludicola]|uniref:hypothetical protein n=1 Tax=Microbacterium paludicola TaxID=300019 RepID=UPI0011A7DB8B|nr:hypothetical protein [Microbacterium paludicola]
MSDNAPAAPAVSEAEAAKALGIPPELVAEKAKEIAKGDGFQAQIFKAIAVQRPVVVEYLRSVRRDNPHASPADLLKELDSRYVATVTITSSGVGASAAIPGIGIPVALGLGVADLLFFYETSALYVLAVAELHGITVDDPERAKPLVLGMLLGQKSQNEISKMVLTAFGAGGVAAARGTASSFANKAVKGGWGEVLTQQLPDSALAPLTIVIGREALKLGGKLGASTVGKAIPFGVGAVIGGLGSFTFGRDVVKSARVAFPETPQEFPEWLLDYERPERVAAEPTRAALALEAASSNAKDFGESVWGKVTAATEAFRSVDLDGDGIPDEARALTAVKRAGTGIAGTANKAADAFRSVDLDGDGVPDEAQALTAVKDAGNAVVSAAGTARDKVSSLFKNRKKATPDDSDAPE